MGHEQKSAKTFDSYLSRSQEKFSSNRYLTSQDLTRFGFLLISAFYVCL